MSYLTAKGWLTTNERELLKSLAEDVPVDGDILNVGIEYGASIVCLRAGNPYATIIGIDLIGGKKITKENREQIGNFNTVLFSGDSGEYVEGWQVQDTIHLAFIDGDHSYRGVMRDTKFAEYIPVGGVIAFHDCYSWDAPPKTPHQVCPEVNQAVQDWYNANRESWKELPHADSIRVFERVA